MRVSRVQCLRIKNGHVCLSVLVLLMLCTFWIYEFQRDEAYDMAGVLHFRAAENPSLARSSPLSERWIVVTSIQKPTLQMHKLASLAGWTMLVVGDLETPENWELPGVKYLSIQEQESLGYSVLQYMAYNSYSRKIVGYLYAIQHGAKVIYDTDDDNAPHDDLRAFDEAAMLVVNTSAVAYNPCAHYGQSSVWPRGYPLDRIGVAPSHTYNVCKESSSVLVKQGLVNGDPDVDAIFRLTRKFGARDLDIRFDASAPAVILPSGTFAPYNSQNTVFEYDALWSLVLPQTVTARITDIWRSYWAQTLLWLVGAHLAYYPPAATQLRNPHSCMNDAVQETEMYTSTPRLLTFLSDWRCPHADLATCAMQLTSDMAAQHFWGLQEIPLYHAWIQDLYSIGYRFPQIHAYSLCPIAYTVTCYPNEQPTSVNYQPDLLDLQLTRKGPLCSEINFGH